MAEASTRRRRGGGRAGNAARRGGTVIDQMPWNVPVNVDRPTEPLDEEGVAAIALHARTVEQHYSGDARWEAIAELKQLIARFICSFIFNL